jgi:hypothetical protein
MTLRLRQMLLVVLAVVVVLALIVGARSLNGEANETKTDRIACQLDPSSC